MKQVFLTILGSFGTEFDFRFLNVDFRLKKEKQKIENRIEKNLLNLRNLREMFLQ